MSSIASLTLNDVKRLSKRELVKALFIFASLLVCSTKAKLLSLMKAMSRSAPEIKVAPEIGGYAVIQHWSNELSDNEDIAFLIKDKAEAYKAAKERFKYFSVREAARHNPEAAEDRPDLPCGNVGVMWATVVPITKALFDRLEQDDPGLQILRQDSSWLGVWTCKINGQDVACSPEEDPYVRVDVDRVDKKPVISRLFPKREVPAHRRTKHRRMSLEP